ncbi:helix-turn-helix domain-containing protein [Brevibacillus brevis]|nr:helix-turn-helix domain-containing protein [Brevibacillus brevis]
MDVKEFGQYLRELRKIKGLSTHELAVLSGVSQSYISHVESGRKKGVPGPDVLKKLSGPLGTQHEELMIKAGHLTSLDWMINFEDSPTYNPAIDAAFEKFDQEKKLKEISTFLQQPGITYQSYQLTDQDKQLITIYLNALFRDRISSEE